MPVLYYLTPLKYFDVYAIARNGFSISFLLVGTVIITSSVAVAQKNWTNREI
jgi:ABC-2 type transport system permease protein